MALLSPWSPRLKLLNRLCRSDLECELTVEFLTPPNICRSALPRPLLVLVYSCMPVNKLDGRTKQFPLLITDPCIRLVAVLLSPVQLKLILLVRRLHLPRHEATLLETNWQNRNFNIHRPKL